MEIIQIEMIPITIKIIIIIIIYIVIIMIDSIIIVISDASCNGGDWSQWAIVRLN